MNAHPGTHKPPHPFQADKAAVGNRIRDLRADKNYTQATLAKLLDKSRPAIAQWENGDATPSLSDIAALAFFLNSTKEYIAFGLKWQANENNNHAPLPAKKDPEGVTFETADFKITIVLKK